MRNNRIAIGCAAGLALLLVVQFAGRIESQAQEQPATATRPKGTSEKGKVIAIPLIRPPRSPKASCRLCTQR